MNRLTGCRYFKQFDPVRDVDILYLSLSYLGVRLSSLTDLILSFRESHKLYILGQTYLRAIKDLVLVLTVA